MISFTVFGNPIPKERPRVVIRDGQPRAYTPKRTKTWERIVAKTARLWCRAAGLPFDGPIALTLTFTRRTNHRCDLDNLSKSVLDALNGIAYHDDAQIRHLTLHLNPPDRNRPRVDITIQPYQEQTT